VVVMVFSYKKRADRKSLLIAGDNMLRICMRPQ
jgi:hypothetical protein